MHKLSSRRLSRKSPTSIRQSAGGFISDVKQVAPKFRASAKVWEALSNALLPDDVPPFGEPRRLIKRRHRVFLERGGAALPEMREIDDRLKRIRSKIEVSFPLDEAEAIEMRARVAEKILDIHDIELEAVGMLRAIITD